VSKRRANREKGITMIDIYSPAVRLKS